MSINTSLTAVADSIRAKTGTTEKMTIAEMPTLINGIETGGGGALDGLEGIDGITEVVADFTTTPTSYESITIDLTEIPANYFQDLKNVKEIKLPNVTKINNYSIRQSDVETLDIGNTLTNLSTNALSGAKKLRTVIFRGGYTTTTFSLNDTLISAGLGYVYVPDELVEAHKAKHDGFVDQIKPLSELEGTGSGGDGTLQSKTVTPTKQQQSVTPDEGNYGLSSVTVEPIPNEYQDISQVSVSPADVLSDKIYVDMTGQHVGKMPNNGDVSNTIDGVNNTSVTIPEGYTSGGTVTYTGSGGEDGSGINPEWTDWRYFSYSNNRNDLVAKLKFTDTSAGANFSQFLQRCSQLTEIPEIDTSSGTNFSGMFSGCTSLKKIPVLNCSKSGGRETKLMEMFLNCGELEYIRFQDKNGNSEGCFPVKTSMNVFSDCPKLTVESLVSFISALKNDTTNKYTITIGSDNLAKLTEYNEQIVSDLLANQNIALA